MTVSPVSLIRTIPKVVGRVSVVVALLFPFAVPSCMSAVKPPPSAPKVEESDGTTSARSVGPFGRCVSEMPDIRIEPTVTVTIVEEQDPQPVYSAARTRDSRF